MKTLARINVVLTGSLKKFTRSNVMNLAAKAFVNVCDKIGWGVDYLVAADMNSKSSKMQAAKVQKIKIISEDEFYKILSERSDEVKEIIKKTEKKEVKAVQSLIDLPWKEIAVRICKKYGFKLKVNIKYNKHQVPIGKVNSSIASNHYYSSYVTTTTASYIAEMFPEGDKYCGMIASGNTPDEACMKLLNRAFNVEERRKTGLWNSLPAINDSFESISEMRLKAAFVGFLV